MEALAAVGLIANVMQFVEFGAKLLSKAHKLHQNGKDIVVEEAELHKVTEDLQNVLLKLKDEKMARNRFLLDMVDDSLKLSHELSALLSSLQYHPENNTIFQSMKHSAKYMRKRGEVHDLESRLGRIRNQICFHLNFLLR